LKVDPGLLVRVAVVKKSRADGLPKWLKDNLGFSDIMKGRIWGNSEYNFGTEATCDNGLEEFKLH
jgi:hypothetical protein